MKKEIVVPVVIASLVFAGVGFFGGMQFQKSKGISFRDGQGNFMMAGSQRGGGPNGGQGGQRMMGQGMRPVTGEIISSDENSITVKMEDGSSKIVLISGTTTINKTDPGSKGDLSVGTKVGVFGADNNGAVTAQSIQINPQQMRIGTPSASPR